MINSFYSLKLVLVILIVVSLAATFKAVYSDDDPVFDILGHSGGLMLYVNLLQNPKICNDLVYESAGVCVILQPLVSYLAGKEKSPPKYGLL